MAVAGLEGVANYVGDVALGVADGGRLGDLTSRLENDLAKLGFEKEKRGFSPHLTIARLRDPRSSLALAQRHVESGFGPVEFEVHETVIYESILRPTGSLYTPIAKLPLRGS